MLKTQQSIILNLLCLSSVAIFSCKGQINTVPSSQNGEEPTDIVTGEDQGSKEKINDDVNKATTSQTQKPTSPTPTPTPTPTPIASPIATTNSILTFAVLDPAVNGVVDEEAGTVSVTVAFRTAVTALVPIITHSGVGLAPASEVPQDFASPITYKVTAADGSTRNYVVSVLVADRDLNLTPDPAEYATIVQDMEGDGTAEAPNRITNVVELQTIIADLDAHYVIANAIDATFTGQWNNGAGFIPIGDNSTSTSASRFTGGLDGASFLISGLTINRPGNDNQGMFAYSSGTLTNLRLVNASVTGKVNSAILVVNNTGTISHCRTSGTVTGIGDNAGGLVNLNDAGGLIEFSSSSATVTAPNYVGGLVGSNSPWSGGSCIIRDSYATGNVSGESNLGGLVGLSWGGAGALTERSFATGNVVGTAAVGGLVGQATMWTTIRNSFATGNVTGTDQVGGFAGLTFRSYTPYSYSTGFVTGSTNTGGFIGRAAQSQATSSIGTYWNSVTSGLTNPFGSYSGGTSMPLGLTSEEMKQGASFSSLDFATIWLIDEGVSPPRLRGTIE